MPLFVAKERGFFRDEGFEAELILMKAPQTIQALLGGSVKFAAAAGTGVSSAVNGAEVRVVLAVSDRPTFDLISQRDITSIQQLRGKKIGVSSIGSLEETLGRRILLNHGLRPDEFTFLGLGPSHITYAALKAGVIDATMLQIPLTFVAQDEGYRALASGGDAFRTVQGGLVTRRSEILEQPALVTRVVRALLRSIRLIRNDRNYAIEFIKSPFLDIGRDQARFAERVYDAVRPTFLESGSVDEEVQREMIADAAQRIKPAHPVTPERVFDFSFARQVREVLR